MQTIDELVTEFGKLDATHQGAEEAIAQHILITLNLVRDKQAYLAKAIQAYAKMLQNEGVKV